jgi:hypothetical protein
MTPSRRAFLRSLSLSLLSLPLAASTQGCKLIFEPPEEALDRFIQAVAMGEDNTFIDMLEGAVEFDYIKRQMVQLKTHFRSSLYKGRTNFWRIEVSEEDAVNDWTICLVTFDIPRPAAQSSRRGSTRANKPDEEVVTFYLRRSYLRWYVIDVDPKEMDAALNTMNKNRGL